MPKSKPRRTDRPTPFARWLQAQLDAHRLLPSGLATLSGIDPSTIGGWLHGENDPEPPKVKLAANALGADLEDVYRVLGWLPEKKREYSASDRQTLNRMAWLSEERRRRLNQQLDLLLAEQESAPREGGS